MGCMNEFVKILQQRFTDRRWQCLCDHIQTSEKFRFCKKFKSLYEAEPYLMLNINRRSYEVFAGKGLRLKYLILICTLHEK